MNTLPPPIISVRDLTIAYRGVTGETTAVSHVNFNIAKGDFVAFVGESGSGKSTLATALIGLLPPSARVIHGSIKLDGRELIGLGERDFSRIRGRRIGLVPQDPAASLNPVLTIGQQVAEVFRLHARRRLGRGDLRDKAIEILGLAGVDRPEMRLKQYPHELSGGLKQRVLIAMAFGLRPDLLIADEPTSALDVTVQDHVLDTFDRLAAEFSTAVLFVTHDLAVATDHATQVFVMRAGTIVEQGPVQDVILRPRHAYTQELLSAAALHVTVDGPKTSDSTRAAAIGKDREPLAGEPPAVRVTGLLKVYRTSSGAGHLVAVDDVSFDIRRGTTFSLVGESGSGKTSVARMVLGLVRPSAGTISVDGRVVNPTDLSARREIWRNVQYVYQSPWNALDPRLSVETTVSEPLVAFGIGDRRSRRERVRELLDWVALPASLAGRRPRDLSGGQRQRVALARALALGADVLVLDEPLSALDVVTQAQITELLGDLQRALGLTYLFISHDLPVVRAISDDVGVMQQGRLVETGRVADVFDCPTSPYTRALLAATPGKRFGGMFARPNDRLHTTRDAFMIPAKGLS